MKISRGLIRVTLPFLATGALSLGCGEGIGDPCIPEQIPPGGFDETEAYIETSSVQCETRVCGVFFLDGDPSPECKQPNPADCADLGDGCLATDDRCAAHRVYCTCRCDAPDDSFATCECPSDYSCERVLDLGGPGVQGSYCVKKGTMKRRR